MEKPRQPLDYAIHSTEEEEFSDYEVENRDMYPDDIKENKR